VASAVALVASLAAARAPSGPATRVTRVEVQLPGALVGYAVPRGPAGDRSVFLLVGGDAAPAPVEPRPCPEESVAPAGRSLALYRFDPAAAERLALVRDDLPGDLTDIDAADLDGDGDEDLLLARPGEILGLDPRGAAGPRSLVRDVGLTWTTSHPRPALHGTDAADAWALSATLGELRLWGPGADGEAWRLIAQVDLPREASVDDAGFDLWSPTPESIGRDAKGRRYFATPPDSVGSSRLHTTLVTVAPDGASSSEECWARLPEAEDVLSSSFLVRDDRPLLLVSTKPADRLGVFGEKRLRIFPLARDRSRLGHLPVFAVESRMNLWQEGHPLLVDVNTDQVPDLVIAYWKGLVDERVVLDAYLGAADGGFEPRARTTAFDVPDGDRSFVHYGSDVTGDGVADLLVRGKPGLLLYPGRASTDGSHLVVLEPRTVDGDGGRPVVADLDGDGAGEILIPGSPFRVIHTGTATAFRGEMR
jgi:hypothetical protein